MITGINTDVEYKGVVYHVQTEEKEPLIETLIYKGGAILNKKSYDYIQKHGDSLSPKEIRKLIEEHHKSTLTSIKNGLFEKNNGGHMPDQEKPIGISNNTLDELLIEYLTSKKTHK